jgi:hypothetical protein
MKKRSLLGTVAAIAGTVYFTRLGLKLAGELRRYDHIRSLSNEGPVMEETPELMMQMLTHEREAVKDWVAFIKAIPKDIVRYTKIETM